MGAFPSGQRGQTVNLLSVTSVVRIHPLPPTKNRPMDGFFVGHSEKGGFGSPASPKGGVSNTPVGCYLGRGPLLC